MNSEDTTSILVNLYNKVSGVPIFDLRAYIEPTAKLNQSTIWKTLTEVFVNGPFMILDLIVGFISLILRFFENFDLYDTYKSTVYDTSKNLWNGLMGSGNYNNSILYVVIAVTSFCIFIGYIFSRGDVGRRLLHLFAVIMLGLGYFGTMQNTSGGIYILDTIHNVANSASSTISNISIVSPENSDNVINSDTSVTDNYIARTAYAAYLYVNTGRLDGYYYNNQTGEAEAFDDSKVLGSVVDGKFQRVDTSERENKKGYLNLLGQDGAEGKEKNRWVSAVSDYLVIKCLYVVLKIVEAVILGLPLILIQLMSFVAQLLVIFLMIAFPLALVVSLAPRMQDVIFNTIKLMLGASFFPVLTGFLTLMVFYIEAIINVFVSAGFNSLSEQDLVSFSGYQPVFELAISTVIQAIVFIAIWKNKEKVLTFILGQNQASSVARLADGVVNAPSQVRSSGEEMYERASDLATSGLLVAGAGAGLALTVKDGIEKPFSKFQKSDYGEVTPNLVDSPDYDKQFEDMKDLSYGEGEPSIEEVDPEKGGLPPYGESKPNIEEVDSEKVDIPSYSENEPSIEDDKFDYDGVYQQNLSDSSFDDEELVLNKEGVSIDDFEQDLSSEESVDYYQQADHIQSDSPVEHYPDQDFSYDSAIKEVEVPETDSLLMTDYVQSDTPVEHYPDQDFSHDSAIKEEVSHIDSSLKTSAELPNDYQTYRKQVKVDKLKDELSNYQSSDDLGHLETGESAFKRGLAKTTTKNRQYRMNKKRMSYIERRLAELRGE